MNQGERVGAWLFRHRGWLPVPVAALCLIAPPQIRPGALALVFCGEALRLAAVGHIGRRSRTRESTVGALVDSGPYARLRNPLYVGNLLIWAGIVWVGWPYGAPGWLFLALHYEIIVRWEESNLLVKLGEPYADYLRRVPRWLPFGEPVEGSYDLREALRSERGTFAVLAVIAAAFTFRWYLGR